MFHQSCRIMNPKSVTRYDRTLKVCTVKYSVNVECGIPCPCSDPLVHCSLSTFSLDPPWEATLIVIFSTCYFLPLSQGFLNKGSQLINHDDLPIHHDKNLSRVFCRWIQSPLRPEGDIYPPCTMHMCIVHVCVCVCVCMQINC